MILITVTNSAVRSIAQFLTVLVVFIFVLFLTYATTRFAGSLKKQQMGGRNIKVIETVAISASKYIQIVNIGDKYFAIGVGKDTITYLCELNSDSLDFGEDTQMGLNAQSFKEILDRFKKTGQVSKDEKDNI